MDTIQISTQWYAIRWEDDSKTNKMAKMEEKIKSAAGEVLGSVVLIGLLFGFCWLCCAASGYHWE